MGTPLGHEDEGPPHRVFVDRSGEQGTADGYHRPYKQGVQETGQDFTANEFRITRALDSLLIRATAITGDEIAGEDTAARVHTLRHLLKQVGHDL